MSTTFSTKTVELPASITRAQIVSVAREWIDTPYLHQASQKGAGTDCLGLVRGVWRTLYGGEPETPPAYTSDWAERHWNRWSDKDPLLEAARRHLIERRVMLPERGDVLIFRIRQAGPAKHCAILTEEERIIHAYAGHNVVETWLSRWWQSRLVGIYAFPGVK